MPPECPMCGRALYLEASTSDTVCLSCCVLKPGEHYTLLSLLTTMCTHNPERTCAAVMAAGSGHCCHEYSTRRNSPKNESTP